MIRLFIADDHAIVREGLKRIVADYPDIVVTGEASDGQEALDKILKNDYDIALLDISMPGKSGLDILKDLKTRKPNTLILVLSIHPEEQYALRALKAGASGYITKESAPDELIAAIRKISFGARYVSPSLAERLVSNFVFGGEKPLHERLSDREYQTMCMIASGKTVSDIARELLLSIKTVSTYRNRSLSKMGMRNNAELISYVIRNQLLD
ncbi:MAG: response regulator transcription factor [Chloroflexi bacterium]|nr:response regulator transcription factor [Chloroflexota bacterium]